MPIDFAGRAIDFANFTPVPQPDEMGCWRELGFDLAIVGASFQNSAFGSNQPRKQLQALQANGFRRQAFSWLRHPFALNRRLMDTAFEQIAGTGVEMMWIDVEDAPSAALVPLQQRVNDVWQAIDYWRNARPDLPLGIYTGKWWWDQWMHGIGETFGLPLWMAAYVLDEEDIKDGVSEEFLKNFIPGGWRPDQVWLWQYAGSVDTCTLNTDRNLILEARRMKYTDEVLDRTFAALIQDLGKKGEIQVALGQGLARVAQDLYTHIFNNGDFTRPQEEVLNRLQAEVEANNVRTEALVAAIRAAGVAFDNVR